jgi:tetratricopeptide (TPR) repeat protein
MPDMKKLIFTAIACCGLFIADAQLKTPAPSPTQTIRQDFGLGNIELSYSRPGMKGRKIFGDLVPFGKVWRTGANQATTVNFTEDVTIGGKLVKAGKYGLITIPEKKNWTVIITKQLDVTSPAAYKQDMDVARVDVRTIDLDESKETFTMQFANIKPSSVELQIMWDKTAVAIPIATDVETKVMAQIDNLMNKDNRPYFAAAMYYMDNAKDLNQAMTWFDKAVELQPKAFWIHHQRANALAKLGKKTEAKTAAETSKSLAIEQKNDDYVKLNEKLIAELDK